MSHSLKVSANKTGRLTLQIETHVVKLSAHFPDITLESFIGNRYISYSLTFTSHKFSLGPVQSSGDEEEVYCTVDIKKFLMFLSGLQMNNCKTLCSIVHRKMVRFFMEQPGALSIQIFLTEISI